MPLMYEKVNANYLSTTPARLVLTNKDPLGIKQEKFAVDFPIGPQKISYGGDARVYSELRRPFEKPILVSNHNQLRTVQFTAMLADLESGGTTSIRPWLERLELFAERSVVCTLSYGFITLGYPVVITRLRKDINARDERGDPVRASVTINLKEAEILDTRLVAFKAVVFYDPDDTQDPDDVDDEQEAVALVPITEAEDNVNLDTEAPLVIAEGDQ